jgi:hypothetical protein
MYIVEWNRSYFVTHIVFWTVFTPAPRGVISNTRCLSVSLCFLLILEFCWFTLIGTPSNVLDSSKPLQI